jgi:hypothetical protein
MVAGCRWAPDHHPLESWKVIPGLGLVAGVAFKSAFTIESENSKTLDRFIESWDYTQTGLNDYLPYDGDIQ